MWREYVRMELGFVESLRRRWSVLGIDVKGKGKDTGMGTGKSLQTAGGAEDPWAELGQGEAEFTGSADDMDVDTDGVGEDEAARQEIMNGAIVKSAITSAVKGASNRPITFLSLHFIEQGLSFPALPKVELFASLHELISAYPSPADLRESLLDYLHACLKETLPSHPDAIKLSATRHLTPNLVGEPLVEALKIANEQLSGNVRTSVGSARLGVSSVYAGFVEEWCKKDVDDTMVSPPPYPPVGKVRARRCTAEI